MTIYPATNLDEFDDAPYLRWNRTLLPIMGIGQDSFYLNEHLAENVTLLDFPKLYDYAYDDYVFQETARKEQNPACATKPYQGELHFCWARLLIDDAFYYATLSSAASYLYGIWILSFRTKRCFRLCTSNTFGQIVSSLPVMNRNYGALKRKNAAHLPNF
ncbi:MAG: hypothetical protein R3C14_02605 [Caldilineaceae bacterium]